MRSADNSRLTDGSASWRIAFPGAAAYLDGLPSGWSSYPECQCAAAPMRFLRVRGAFDDMPPLPEPVAETLALVERDPSFDWVPETRYVALLLAVHDHAFPGDSPGFLDWLSEASAERVAVTDQDSELLRGSVQQLLEAAPSVWARYRRGTCSQLERIAAGEAVILLPHPTALFPRVVLEYFARTLETALARVDAANPCVRVDTLDLGGDRAETRFLVSWDAPGVQRT